MQKGLKERGYGAD